MDDIEQTSKKVEMAHAQALAYGQDLVRIFNQEKAKRQELELANQKLNAIWATAPNGLALLDEQMCIIQTNPRFEALVEQPGQCNGRDLIEVLPSPELAEVLAGAAAHSQPFSDIEVTIVDPMQRTLQITGAVLAAGDHKGWVVSLHDLTERKRLEGLKEEFIDIAAHELRTPLAIILGFTSVLSEDDLYRDEMTAAPVDAIVQAANRLKMIVNELVDFAATKDSDKAIGSIDEFDIWEVLEHSIGGTSPLASQTDIQISLDNSQVGPLVLSGDRVIIAQAIGHILENAIRFNKPGGKVMVTAAQTNTHTTIQIEDTGIGMSSTELDRIFEMFYQVEEHMTRARGGLGMGLSVAKRGIELHGGSISVTSILDVGSCFVITLPNESQTMVISSQERLDTAHKQTLAYGRDLARAFMAQRHLKHQLDSQTQIAQQIVDQLDAIEIQETGPDLALQREIGNVRRLAKKISAQANQEGGASR